MHNTSISPRKPLLAALLLAPLLFAPRAASAQDAALNDKLRDLLRQTTEQLRGAQDSAASLQAQLDAMTKQRDALTQQLAAAAAKPVVPAVTPQQQAALQQAQAEAAAAQSRLRAEAAQNARLQQAGQQAVQLAREREATDLRVAAELKQASGQLGICKSENTRLIATAEDILHLYETPRWNQLLVANHERLLGFARVRLQNQVQDYEDRIQTQAYLDPAAK